jgi:Domain of unknown function (DUF6431)
MVVILVRDEALAQDALDAGQLRCPHPGCGGVVRRDGHARQRRVRTRDGQQRSLRPQRVACRQCARVQVLLPSWCVPRRADDAETIGVALLHAAQGRGHRPIAALLGRPLSTVRGWLRAARANAIRVERHAYLARRAMEQTHPPRMVCLPHAGTPLGYAVDALGAAAAAARRHFGDDGHQSSPWALLMLLGGARLLAPLRLQRDPPALAA